MNTDGVKTFHCDLCGKVFKRKEHIKNHLNAHLKKRSICSLCGRWFHPLALKRHKEQICSGIPKKNYPCNQCGKKFTRKEHVRSHILRVHSKLSNVSNNHGKN